jgi:hypothetical protein
MCIFGLHITSVDVDPFISYNDFPIVLPRMRETGKYPFGSRDEPCRSIGGGPPLDLRSHFPVSSVPTAMHGYGYDGFDIAG